MKAKRAAKIVLIRSWSAAKNCLRYQLDGHFETMSGSVGYLVGLPWSAIRDAVLCGEEISRGWWNHVN